MAKRRKRDRSDSVSDVEPAVAEPAVVEPAKPDRQDKKESRTDRRSDLLDAKAQLQSAKSQKWKWLFNDRSHLVGTFKTRKVLTNLNSKNNMTRFLNYIYIIV